MSSTKQQLLDQQQLIDQLHQENQELRQAVQLSEDKLQAALDGSEMKIWQLHVPSQTLQVFNAAWGALLGFRPDEVEASVAGWKSNLHPDDKAMVVSALEEHLRGESDAFQVVHRMLRKDGGISWIRDRGKIVEFDEYGKPVRMVGAHIDITQEKLYEERLAKLLNTDPLTGLLNRAALIEKYNQLSGSAQGYGALLFLDLDDFKKINDQFGHKFGDVALCHIADIMCAVLPECADICRFGGDEFVILFEIADRAALQKIAEKLLRAFEQPLSFDDGGVKIGMSIGICIFSIADDDFSSVCQRADQAMYQVKKSGKNDLAFF